MNRPADLLEQVDLIWKRMWTGPYSEIDENHRVFKKEHIAP